jgi:hypothetical protein
VLSREGSELPVIEYKRRVRSRSMTMVIKQEIDWTCAKEARVTLEEKDE